jgi:hypothetical protein
MSVSSAIRSILVADSAVYGLVGSRVYPQILPDGKAMPAITYQRQYKNPHDGLSGSFGTGVYNYDVSCWSDNYDEAESLGTAAQAALVDYAGTVGGVTIQHIWVDDADDVRFHAPDNQRLQRFGRILEISVFTG